MQRIWIYQADRELTGAEEQHMLSRLEEFTGQWRAHGKQLAATAEVRHRRFIILMVDERVAPPTGCSIDKSVHLLKEVEQETGLVLFDRMQVAYREGDSIHVVSRDEFAQRIASGVLTADTIVFNNLIASYPELADKWEVPVKESWHARVFL
jgi:hypothetical protein